MKKHKILFRMYFTCLWMFLTSVTMLAQNGQIRGTVADVGGEPLIGVNITIKGTEIGAVTDLYGKFELKNTPSTGTMLISYIGYKQQEIPLGQNFYKITLKEDEEQLDEVVVIGYGTQRKSDLTGSVTSIKAKDLTGINGGNASEALQGKAGVHVITSGSPGTAPQVRVRGIGTNGDATPIYVVDGVMTSDIAFLNPKDIESMEVLKDASATAIYGSRGANGVIMISTKRGKAGKVTVSYNGSEGFQFVKNNYDICDGTEYAILMNMVARNNGKAMPYSDPSTIGKGTDWMDRITRNGWMRDHQLSVSGGSDAVIYNISAGYTSQEGIWNNTDYERWTFRINNEYKLSPNFKIGHNLSLSISDTGQGLNYRMVRSVLSGSPLVTPKKEDGDWSSMQNGDLINPEAELYLGKDQNNNMLNFLGNFWAEWKVLDGLTLRTSFGDTWADKYNWVFRTQYNINPSHQSNPYNSYSEYYDNTNTWLWENTINYTKQINDNHYLNLLGGYTMEKSKFRGIGGEGHSYIVDNLDYVSLGTADAENRKLNPYNRTITSRMSYIFRGNYTLMNRYLLTATFRADGSSVFGTNNRWGYFPSAALGWRVKEEAFLKDVDWLSNLKLRASWGITGNDKIKSNVSYALVTRNDEYHAIFNGIVHPGAGITNASNPDIKWERNEQLDLGFDLGFINNKLTLEFDYFNRTTKDLLMILPVEGGSVGISPTYSNLGAVQNHGYEFTAKWQDGIGDFSYGISFSGSSFKNKVTDWGGQITTNTEYSTNLTTRIEEGKPFGYFFGNKTQGIYRTQADLDKWNQYAKEKGKEAYHANAQLGDLIYVDVNGDGTINDDDLTDIGNPFPKFTSDLSINAEYKGFDLVLDFTGSFGAKVMNNSYNDFNNDTNNMHRDWLNSWTPENPNAAMPRLVAGSVNMSRTIDLMVLDGDYVKLRSAELGYSFPSALINKAGINKLRIYVNASNLFYWTKYKGFSPEILNGLDNNSYPMVGSFQFGVNLAF